MLSPLVLLRDLHAHTSKSEWIVNYGCTHYMSKATLFSSFSSTIEEEMFVAYDCSIIVSSSNRIECQNGVITDVYHVPSLNVNLFYVPQLT
jgi:hypothetical protein